MKNLFNSLMIPLILFIPFFILANPQFDAFFNDQTMRIDYYHIGDAKTEIVTIDRIYQYDIWAGSLKNLIDQLNYGAYFFKIYDAASEKLIYSKGFDSYFKEYQTSGKALKGIQHTFHESALVPFPKKAIIFSLEKRQKEGNLKEVFRTRIDPADVSIIRNEGPDRSVKLFKSLENGDPHQKIDIAIIGEGYTEAEKDKFVKDLQRFTEIFFKKGPSKTYKDRFNVYGVFKPSQESGVDEPRHHSFKNTALSATFNSMGSPRYLLTEDNKALRDIARHTPYDALYIMVNHGRYGGGGIYNFYCTFTSDNQWSEYLMLHEFGHSFFGLADEYYSSSVAYTDFYPAGYEPVEPNITALLDPANLKWKHLLSKDIPLPSPWNKKKFDKQALKWRKKRERLNEKTAELKRKGASTAKIEAAKAAYDRASRGQAENLQKLLKRDKSYGKVGAFEGAGYTSTGLYRPMVDCRMFSKGADHFCKVCEDAMVKVIRQYTE